jgi:hypothetical protein
MFSYQGILVLSPILGLVVDCACHVVVSNCISSGSVVRKLFMGVLAGLVAVAAISAVATSRMGAQGQDRWGLMALNILTYLALAYGYVGYVSMNMTSLRIRVLKEVLECGGGLPKAQLLARYSGDDVVSSRIRDLISGGYLIDQGGRLHSGKPAVLIIAILWDFMRWVVLGRNRTPFPSLPQNGSPAKPASE